MFKVICVHIIFVFIYLSKEDTHTSKRYLYLCTLVLFVVEEGILQRLDKGTPAAMKKEH